MTYSIKEMFYTLQGEGAQTGTPAVFCRFTGCNLWSGREKDRPTAVCQFCDTDFVGTDGIGGEKFKNETDLALKIADTWTGSENKLVVFTGGEPALQLDEKLIDAVHDKGFRIAVETNGTLPLPQNIDWVCVSPKAGSELQVTSGDELKLVFPQIGIDPSVYLELDFSNYFLQPMDANYPNDFVNRTIEYCKKNSNWRFSTQTHKVLNIP